MKKKILIWVVLVWAAVASVQGQHSAYATQSDEAYAVSLVNQIRQDPLGYAEGLGYDRNVLLGQLPWIWMTGAANGLGAVTVSEVLTRRAEKKNTDGIVGNLAITIIGESFGEEAAADTVTMNTDYAAQGDISGVITFNNFMDRSAAIDVVINSQFKKELDPDYTGKRILVSAAYKLIGASFYSGTVQSTSGSVNAYIIYICLSSSMLKSEVQVVNMLNQVRDNPAEAYNYLSLDLSFLQDSYRPLFFYDALEVTAKVALYEEVDFLSHALGLGFPWPTVGYTSGIETFPVAAWDTLAMWTFSSLMARETEAYPGRDTMFSTLWNEVGAGLYRVGDASYDSVKLTMVTGQSGASTNGLFRIYGVAYVDEDLNGVYTIGEEAVGRLVTAYNNSTGMKIQNVVTNRAGQFSFSLSGNVVYNIETINNEIRTGRLVVLNNDLYLPLSVQ